MTEQPRPVAGSADDRTPGYYLGGGNLQPWDVVDAFELDFWLGNVAKYVCRAGRKNPDPMPDLTKALHYLQEKIRRVEAEAGHGG